jgi:hypothetical protein
MLTRYSHSTPNGEALLAVLSAKKDAEIAPGVGTETDLAAIGPQLGQSFILPEALTKKVEQTHAWLKGRTAKLYKQANEEVERYVNEVGKAAVEKQAQPASAEGAASAGTASDHPGKA